MIIFLLWLLFGGLVGWLASLVMQTDNLQGILRNVVVGIAGALLGGFLLALLGIGGANLTTNDVNMDSLLVAFVGAIILLAIVNLVQRGRVR